MPMVTVRRYARFEAQFAPDTGIDRVCFTSPDGDTQERPAFLHQPVAFEYDDRGYEHVHADGPQVLAVRMTPDACGEWQWEARSGETSVANGSFTCGESDHPGYVGISQSDPRYFACTDGSCYVPVGPNLIRPTSYALSKGAEFERSENTGTLGCKDYIRWFRSLRENGCNYTRLWLSNPYFQAEGEVAGELDLTRFSVLDQVIDLARANGVRLKLCLEHFRMFEPGSFTSRMYRHPEDDSSPADMDEWFTSEKWQSLWMRKVTALMARHADDPAVFAWELWNEIDCCRTSGFAVQREWTRRMLGVLKQRSPRNLAVNSLGSFDHERKQSIQDDFKMNEMDFQQVHRYLDQGAKLAVCHDPVAGSIDAVKRSRREDRPVILTETGAVNDNHTGPFRWYRADHRGVIFHDTTYPAVFAGAAGSGHIWHWADYVDNKNLWSHYRPLTQALAGVAVDREMFHPFDLSTESVWCLGLRGNTTTLLWLRNKQDRWDRSLRDDRMPETVKAFRIDLAGVEVSAKTVEVFTPWPETPDAPRLEKEVLAIPAFRYGMVLRLR